MGEFDAAARDPGVVLAFDGESGVLGQEVTGFLYAGGAGVDEAGHDEGLGFRAGFHQTSGDKHEIGALFGHYGAVSSSSSR